MSELPLGSLADLDAIVVRKPYDEGLATDAADFEGREVRGRAVLVHTGWDAHWRTAAYFDEHPFLTAAAADWLVANGAAFVGIDSHNIDHTRTRSRPVHITLLAAGIRIGEHLTNLGAVPNRAFRFSAVPPKVKRMRTLPVRAHARVVA